MIEKNIIKSVIILGIVTLVVTILWKSNISRTHIEDESSVYNDTTLVCIEQVSGNSQINEINKEVSNEKMEGEVPYLEETKFTYVTGRKYNETSIPKRFGYVVEEEFVNREITLHEDDFKKLKKGQYIDSSHAEVFKSDYTTGIIESIGMYDGQIMFTARALGTGMALTSPYYKINDDVYVILFFEDTLIDLPLESVEVWDAEGNKLREIEID